ncbi:MAG TPA: hypothetical protein VLD57_06965 [Blastocatellia bacterium]|nr:hypothetical protein [Blastocatellia bacterium]
MVPPRSAFTQKEMRIIDSHRTPAQVQKFLSNMPYNRETGGATCLSFRSAIRQNRAHCLEGALVATVILEQHGYPPLLISIESQDRLDHVLFLYKKGDRYGSVARSRDIGLHGRKPVFRTVRDLVMSYYDPYIDKTGRITGYGVANLHDLRSYNWRFSEKNVWKVERHLQEIPHRAIRGSDDRYRKWHARYLEYKKRVPDGSPDYYPTRDIWML